MRAMELVLSSILLLIASQASATNNTETTQPPTTALPTTAPPTTTPAATTPPTTTPATTTQAPIILNTTQAIQTTPSNNTIVTVNNTTAVPATTQAAPTQTPTVPCFAKSSGCTADAEIIKHTGKTVAECEQLCLKDTRCKVFVYGGNGNTSDCVLTTGSSTSCTGNATTDIYVLKNCTVCSSGYFRNSSGLCEKNGVVYKGEMKLTMNFTADLANPNSAAFKDLAQKVGDGLFASLKKSVPGAVAVNVYAFKEGSVVAEYNIVMGPNAAAVDKSSLQSAVNNAITTGDFGGLPVDKTYLPDVTEESGATKPPPTKPKGLSAGVIVLIIICVIVIVPLLIYGLIKYRRRFGYERANP